VPRLRLRARVSLPIALAISLAGGIVMSLAFPPAAAWPLAFVALIPLLWLLADAGPMRGLALGFAYGIGFYGATLYWIYRFGFGAWTALTLLSAAAVAVFAAAYPALKGYGRPLLAALSAAALWTVVDWIRGMWPLGGFTWGSVGVSQADDRALLRLASVTGVWGVTFVVVLVNGLLLAAVTGGGGTLRRSGRVSFAALLVLAPLSIAFPVASGRPVDIATVQVDVRLAQNAPSALDEDLQVAGLNIDQLRKLAGNPPDLAVTGEGSFDPGAAADPGTIAALRSAITAVGAPTLVGAVTNDVDARQRTDVLLFDAAGDLVDRYDKVHLVPFGEYVPWRSHLSWFRAIDQIPVDRAPGERVHALYAPGLPAFGTPICFENGFPDIPRDMVRDGAEFLIVPVNNASYGFTAASEQHEQMSRIRAVEDGRWFVDSAVSGISAFIDPSGSVTQHLGLFNTGILRGTIRSSDARTLYVRLGDWVPWLSFAFVAGVFLVPRRRAPARPAPGALPFGFRTLVVLPTYEEKATIKQVVEGVLAAPQQVDVLVVDDSSPDGTGELVRGMAEALSSSVAGSLAVSSTEPSAGSGASSAPAPPRLRLLQRERKAGLASAYLDGFALALGEGYDLVVEMDSDMSHDPLQLPSLLAATAEHSHMTVGSRYIPGGSITDWSPARLALSRAGNIYARAMLGIPIHDATSGFRVYRHDLLKELTAEPFHADGYGFQIELVRRAWNLGYTLGEVPITFRERVHGQSKISRRIVVEALWLVTKWGLRDRISGRRR
jgi:apolipoprotein N-acyltransferase